MHVLPVHIRFVHLSLFVYCKYDFLSSILLTCLFLLRVNGSLEAIPACTGRENIVECHFQNRLMFFLNQSFFHFSYRNTLSDYAVFGLTPEAVRCCSVPSVRAERVTTAWCEGSPQHLNHRNWTLSSSYDRTAHTLYVQVIIRSKGDFSQCLQLKHTRHCVV